MRKGFEVNGDYRLMDSSELVYILTNSAVMVNKVQEKEVVYGEECSFEDVLAKMTPGKRNLVMAGVELYKRCNSNKNQRPVFRLRKLNLTREYKQEPNPFIICRSPEFRLHVSIENPITRLLRRLAENDSMKVWSL